MQGRALIAIVFLSLALLPALRAQEAEPVPSWKWNAETVLLKPRVAAAEISPDGTQVVYVRTRPRTAGEKPGAAWMNLWIVPVAGGDAKALTSGDAVDAAPAWSPDSKSVAFISARGEGQKRQVWMIPAAGGEPKVLTASKTPVQAFRWSPDGSRLAYTALLPQTEAEENAVKEGRDWTIKEKSEKPILLYVHDLAAKTAAPLASLGSLSAHEFNWSADGTAILANVAATPLMDDSYMNKRTVLLPVGAGLAKDVARIGGKIGDVQASPDGKTAAFLAAVDRSDPYQGSLHVVACEGGKPNHLTEKIPSAVMAFGFRKDGTIAALLHEGTKSTIRTFDVSGGEPKTIVPKGPVVFTSLSISADGKSFASVGSSADHPNEVFAGSFDGAAPVRLTKTTPELEALPRGKQETIAWSAKDGVQIEGVLIHPVGFDGRTKHPLIVCVHGGPESHEPDNWKTTDYIRLGQAAAERGWFILYPNYRGSTGRGPAFQKLDQGDLGGKEFDDVVDGIDFLAAKGWVDPKKVGAIGGSYGGYFTAWAVTKLSNRFAVGVEHFGISNWLSFMGQTDIPTENEIVHMARPFYDNFDLYWDRSPIRWIKNSKTPTIIMQGAADDRVPKPQADELFQGLKRNGVPVEYVIYPREGHGYRERAHVIDAFERAMTWFETYLK